MDSIFFEDKVFKNQDYTENFLTTGEYENCSFFGCVFTQSDLSGISFVECRFESCDFSMTKLRNTTFNDIRFISCKMLGLNFTDCNRFVLSVYFENCQLNLSSFFQLKLKKTKFSNCSLHEVDFAETVLSGSVFDNCDFNGAMFENTALDEVDFRSSNNYAIDPELNSIKKAKFSWPGIAGLLVKYDIQID